MAKVENEVRHGPIHLAWMVKKVARLCSGIALAAQPDSPSRQAGWGLGPFAFLASRPTLFTIRASRMGPRGDKIAWATSPARPCSLATSIVRHSVVLTSAYDYNGDRLSLSANIGGTLTSSGTVSNGTPDFTDGYS